MDDKLEEKTNQKVSDEASHFRTSAQTHLQALKDFWGSFAITGLIAAIALIIAAVIGLGWFLSNSKVKGTSVAISSAGSMDFALATVGSKAQGVYDSSFDLSADLTIETIDEVDYYVASANGSFRVDSDKSFNNYLANADLRPGNRGNFDLYIICRNENRKVVLQPVFSAWYEVTSSGEVQYTDAFLDDDPTRKNAAEFLKGHILLFADMDVQGMYSGYIDFTKEITIDLSSTEASQIWNDNFRVFNWGECVYQDENADYSTAVYRLPVYWVWPEQFGNYIYTGNSYNKNLFKSDASSDYLYFVSSMESDDDYKKYFYIEGDPARPEIKTITDPKDYQVATTNYELYSDWYNMADEQIGSMISYIELGFEISQTD